MVEVAYSTSGLKVLCHSSGNAAVCETCCADEDQPTDGSTVGGGCCKCFGINQTPVYYTVGISGVQDCGSEETYSGTLVNGIWKLEIDEGTCNSGEVFDETEWELVYPEEKRFTFNFNEGGGGPGYGLSVQAFVWNFARERWWTAFYCNPVTMYGGTQCDYTAYEMSDQNTDCSGPRAGSSGTAKWCPFWYAGGCP